MQHLALAVLTVVLAAGTSVAGAQPADKAAAAAVQSATQGTMKLGKGTRNDPDCGQVEYETEAVDLNGDGQLEVLTQEFGSCFGGAGVQLNLYIKAKNGQWVAQFGFPGAPKILKTRSHGFPDIEILGPGMCSPVWRYNGLAYDIFKKCR